MKFLEMSVPLPSAMKASALYVFKPLHPSPDSEHQQIFFHHSHARTHTHRVKCLSPRAWPKMHLWKRLEKSKERLYMRSGRWTRVCDSHFALISTLGSTGLCVCVCVCVNNTKPVFWTHSAGI